jgi:hypothetical protein
VEAAPRLDGRPDDHELRSPLGGHPRDLLAEAAGSGTDDLPPYVDAVGARDRGRGLETPLEAHALSVEMRVERQLALEDGRGHEHDTGAAVGREAAGEVERVLGLLPVEQRHDDAAVGDRARPAREAPRAPAQQPEVRHPHRISW